MVHGQRATTGAMQRVRRSKATPQSKVATVPTLVLPKINQNNSSTSVDVPSVPYSPRVQEIPIVLPTTTTAKSAWMTPRNDVDTTAPNSLLSSTTSLGSPVLCPETSTSPTTLSARLQSFEQALLETSELYRIDMSQLEQDQTAFLEITTSGTKHVDSLFQQQFPLMNTTRKETKDALAQLEHDIQQLHIRHRDEKQSLQQQLDGIFEVEEAKRLALEQTHREDVMSLQTRLNAHDEEIAALKQAHAQALEDTQRHAQQEVLQIQQNAHFQVQEQERIAQDKIEMLQQHYATEREALIQTHACTVAALETQHVDEMQALRQELVKTNHMWSQQLTQTIGRFYTEASFAAAIHQVEKTKYSQHHEDEIERIHNDAAMKLESTVKALQAQVFSIQDTCRRDLDRQTIQYQSERDLHRRTSHQELQMSNRLIQEQFNSTLQSRNARILTLESLVQEHERKASQDEFEWNKKLNQARSTIQQLTRQIAEQANTIAQHEEHTKQLVSRFEMQRVEKEAQLVRVQEQQQMDQKTLQDLRQELQTIQDALTVKTNTIVELTFVVKSRDAEVLHLRTCLVENLSTSETPSEHLELSQVQLENKLLKDHYERENELKQGEIRRAYSAQSELKQQLDAAMSYRNQVEETLRQTQVEREELKRRIEFFQLETQQQDEENHMLRNKRAFLEQQMMYLQNETTQIKAQLCQSETMVTNAQFKLNQHQPQLEQAQMYVEDVQMACLRYRELIHTEIDDRWQADKQQLLTEVATATECANYVQVQTQKCKDEWQLERQQLKETIQQREKEHQKAVGELQTVYEQLIRQEKELQESKSRRDEEIKAQVLEIELKTAHQALSTLQNALNGKENALVQAEKLLDQCKHELQTLHNENAVLTEREAALSEEVDGLQAKIADYVKTEQEIEAQIAALQKDVKAARQVEVPSLREVIGALRTQLWNAEDELKASQSALQDASVQHQRLTEQINSHQQSLDTDKALMKSIDAERVKEREEWDMERLHHQTVLSEYANELDHVRAELEAIRNVVKNQEEASQTLKNELVEAQNQLQTSHQVSRARKATVDSVRKEMELLQQVQNATSNSFELVLSLIHQQLETYVSEEYHVVLHEDVPEFVLETQNDVLEHFKEWFQVRCTFQGTILNRDTVCTRLKEGQALVERIQQVVLAQEDTITIPQAIDSIEQTHPLWLMMRQYTKATALDVLCPAVMNGLNQYQDLLDQSRCELNTERIRDLIQEATALRQSYGYESNDRILPSQEISLCLQRHDTFFTQLTRVLKSDPSQDVLEIIQQLVQLFEPSQSNDSTLIQRIQTVVSMIQEIRSLMHLDEGRDGSLDLLLIVQDHHRIMVQLAPILSQLGGSNPATDICLLIQEYATLVQVAQEGVPDPRSHLVSLVQGICSIQQETNRLTLFSHQPIVDRMVEITRHLQTYDSLIHRLDTTSEKLPQIVQAIENLVHIKQCGENDDTLTVLTNASHDVQQLDILRQDLCRLVSSSSKRSTKELMEQLECKLFNVEEELKAKREDDQVLDQLLSMSRVTDTSRQQRMESIGEELLQSRSTVNTMTWDTKQLEWLEKQGLHLSGLSVNQCVDLLLKAYQRHLDMHAQQVEQEVAYLTEHGLSPSFDPTQLFHSRMEVYKTLRLAQQTLAHQTREADQERQESEALLKLHGKILSPLSLTSVCQRYLETLNQMEEMQKRLTRVQGTDKEIAAERIYLQDVLSDTFPASEAVDPSQTASGRLEMYRRLIEKSERLKKELAQWEQSPHKSPQECRRYEEEHAIAIKEAITKALAQHEHTQSFLQTVSQEMSTRPNETTLSILEQLTRRDNTAISMIYRLIRLATDILNTSAFTSRGEPLSVEVTQSVLTCVKELKNLKEFLVISLQQVTTEHTFLSSNDRHDAQTLLDKETAIEAAIGAQRECLASVQTTLQAAVTQIHTLSARLGMSLAQYTTQGIFSDNQKAIMDLELERAKERAELQARQAEWDIAVVFHQRFVQDRKQVEEAFEKALADALMSQNELRTELEHVKQQLVQATIAPQTPRNQKTLLAMPIRPDSKPRGDTFARPTVKINSSGMAHKGRFVSDLERETGQRRTSTAMQRREEQLSSEPTTDYMTLSIATPSLSRSPSSFGLDTPSTDSSIHSELWYQGVRTIHHMSFFISVYYISNQRLVQLEIYNSDRDQCQTIYLTWEECQAYWNRPGTFETHGVEWIEIVFHHLKLNQTTWQLFF